MRLESNIFSPPLGATYPLPVLSLHCFRGMDVILRPIFSILTVPDLKIKQPTWLHVCITYCIYVFHRFVINTFNHIVNAFRPPLPGPSLHLSSPPTSSSLAASSTMSLLNLPGSYNTVGRFNRFHPSKGSLFVNYKSIVAQLVVKFLRVTYQYVQSYL